MGFDLDVPLLLAEGDAMEVGFRVFLTTLGETEDDVRLVVALSLDSAVA